MEARSPSCYALLSNILNLGQVTNRRPTAMRPFIPHLEIETSGKLLGCLEIQRCSRDRASVLLEDAIDRRTDGGVDDEPEEAGHEEQETPGHRHHDRHELGEYRRVTVSHGRFP